MPAQTTFKSLTAKRPITSLRRSHHQWPTPRLYRYVRTHETHTPGRNVHGRNCLPPTIQLHDDHHRRTIRTQKSKRRIIKASMRIGVGVALTIVAVHMASRMKHFALTHDAGSHRDLFAIEYFP